MTTRSAPIPRASLHINYDQAQKTYQMHLTEDVINRQKTQLIENSANSHMIHGQGCWDIDKTYWINFHQNKSVATELWQITKIVNFIK